MSNVIARTVSTVVAGIDCATVKIPTDRAAAMVGPASTYGIVKAACDLAWKDVTTKKGAAYQPAMNAWLAEYKYPRMLLWNRIAKVHQGNQGLTGAGNDAFLAYVKAATK